MFLEMVKVPCEKVCRAGPSMAAVALLKRNNLQLGQDVKFLYLGGVREVLAALERGIVSAGVLSAPTTLLVSWSGGPCRANSPSVCALFSKHMSPASKSATRIPRSASAPWPVILRPTMGPSSMKRITLFAGFSPRSRISSKSIFDLFSRSRITPRPPAPIPNNSLTTDS